MAPIRAIKLHNAKCRSTLRGAPQDHFLLLLVLGPTPTPVVCFGALWDVPLPKKINTYFFLIFNNKNSP